MSQPAAAYAGLYSPAMRAFVALTFALLGALNQRLPSDVPTLTAPTRQAPAMTEDERAALNAGIALLNEKQYDQAIAKYRTVLAANADSAGAMYEIALALTQKGEYAQAIEMAMKSAQYDTVDLAKCLALIGTAFDLGGEPRKAIEVYERAIAIVPGAGTLHYNKAVAELQSLREPSLALASLKRGAMADPAHATTQQMLGRMFGSDDLRTPAVMAFSRFLILEPASSRTPEVYKLWYSLLFSNLRQTADGKFELAVNPAKKTTEGELLQLDTFIALSQLDTASLPRTTPPGARVVRLFTSYLNAVAGYDAGKDASTFLWTYYVPYFKQMRERDFVEPFVYHVSRSVGMPGAQDWLAENKPRVDAFLAWDKTYAWR